MLAEHWRAAQRHFQRGLMGLVLSGPLQAATAPTPPAVEPEGRMVHLMSQGISFRVLEPANWKLDLRAAPQLAVFLLHPDGLNWRRAETVIYANFLPKQDKSLAEFLEKDRERFREDCGCPDEPASTVEPRALGLFMLQQYRCPGLRDEVMAAAEVGDFHFVFLLTTQSEKAMEEALPVFEKVVTSFTWARRGGQ